MKSATRKTVLIVEDNPDLRCMLEVQLSRYFNVVLCDCGNDALEKIGACGHIDVVVTDVNLGAGMNGWSLIRHIKQDRSIHVERIAVVSADIGAVDIGWLCGIPVLVKGSYREEDLLSAII